MHGVKLGLEFVQDGRKSQSQFGTRIACMRVMAVKMLSDFYRQDAYRDCAGPAKAWYALATAAQWVRPPT